MKTILIDPGHGITTPGKGSPDGTFREWEGNRRLARRIVEMGRESGLDCRLLFDSDADIPLGERARMANRHPADSTVLLSIHSNAAGNGSSWHNARGFSAYVGTRGGLDARRLAALLTDEAGRDDLLGNRAVPSAGYWEQSLAICNLAACPAVLTENLFMDNPEDLALLRSGEGTDRLAHVHIRALTRFLR